MAMAACRIPKKGYCGYGELLLILHPHCYLLKMKNNKTYEQDDKMVDLIRDNYNVLQALGSFGINLGFGNKTVRETCEDTGVDAYTFLAVVNYTVNGCADYDDDGRISVPTLLHYLKASHVYYLDFQLPFIRRQLADALNETGQLDTLIMKCYDEYAREVRKHMMYEEKTLFPYVDALLGNVQPDGYDVDTFSKHHEQTDRKLVELKSIIIKYLPGDVQRNHKLTATLYHIYNCEEWLRCHADVEDRIFVPAIRRMEKKVRQSDVSKNISTMVFKSGPDSGDLLSDRERDVVVCVVQGMSNKEIASSLFISLNTVITHRRNIARKLQIHSSAGLTIYAIVNGLVDIGNVKL